MFNIKEAIKSSVNASFSIYGLMIWHLIHYHTLSYVTAHALNYFLILDVALMFQISFLNLQPRCQLMISCETCEKSGLTK